MEEKHNLTLSEESGIGESQKAFNTRIFCPDSSLYLVLFYYYIPDRFLRPFENDRQAVNSFYKKLQFLSSLAVASPEYGGKCRSTRGDRGMLAYTGQNI